MVTTLQFHACGKINAWAFYPDAVKPKARSYGHNPILMQYTGLKDKNSKEIYEGDILLADNDYVDEGNLYLEVKWNDKQTGFYLYDTKHDIDCDPDEFELIGECYQVIGNIYETPELLNV